MLGSSERPVGGLAIRPPPGVELRPLGRDDRELAVALAREQRDLPALPDTGDLAARFERLINSADAAPFLAIADGEPAGMVVLSFRRRLNFATFEGWLSDLYVRPPFRGRGIGRSLLEAVIAEWRLRRGHRILVHVPQLAEAARAVLQAQGFSEFMIDFWLSPVTAPAVSQPGGASIRPLSTADFEAVTRLIAEFGPRRSPVPDRMEAMRRTFVQHAHSVASGAAASLVAEVDKAVAGVVIVEWREPFWDTRRVGWIPDLVVTEPMRGRGIGRALLEAALRSAAGVEASEMFLESAPQRLTAHRLYASMGFDTTGRTFVLEREVGEATHE